MLAALQIASLLTIIPFVTEPPSQSFTLPSAIQKAIENNPDIREAEDKVHEAEALGGLAWSKVLPSVSGLLQANTQKDAVGIGTPRFNGDAYNLYTAELTGFQPIYSWGLFSGLNGSRLEGQIKREELKISKRDLGLNVMNAYYKILLAKNQLGSLQKNEKIEREVLKTAEHRHQIGRGQLLDVLQIKTQLALLNPKIEKASNDLKSAASELAHLLGDPNANEIQIEGRLDAPHWEEFSILISKIPSEIPEIKRIQFLEKQTSDTTSNSLGKYWPQLNAQGSWGKTGTKKTALVDDFGTFWSVGLQLNVPIFSGLGWYFEKQSLESKEAQVLDQEMSLRNSIGLQQVKTRKDIDSAASLIHSNEEAAKLAATSLSEATRSYRFATIDYVRYLAAEQSLLDSELALDQARFDYIGLLGKYFSASGYDIQILVKSLASG